MYGSPLCAAATAGPPNFSAPVMLPAASWATFAATATDTGTIIVSPLRDSLIAPSYIPYGVSAGTASRAGNEPLAWPGVVSHDQSPFSYQSIWMVKSVFGTDVLPRVCWKPTYSPSAIRLAGSRTSDISSLASGRLYMKRTYSPRSISERPKSCSGLASMSVPSALLTWSTAPSWSRSVHSRWSRSTSVQL